MCFVLAGAVYGLFPVHGAFLMPCGRRRAGAWTKAPAAPAAGGHKKKARRNKR